MTGLDARVLWHATPPRVRVEEALIDVASNAGDDLSAIAVLSDAVQARRTTPRRLSETLQRRTRVARRTFLTAVLADLAEGTGSVLEHGYLTRVERPHGLPRGQRQARSRSAHRDVLHPDFGLVVELDGRAFHSSHRQRVLDLGRDLEAAVDGLATVRIGWGQVFGQPCRTAEQVAALLRVRGWSGRPRPCPDCA